MRGAYGRTGRVSFRGGSEPGWMTVPCPTCSAKRGWSCWQLGSWVRAEVSPTGEGFFARVRKTPHPERKVAAQPTTAAPSDRGVLRDRINALTFVKLGGSDRMRVRRWASDVARTDDELIAKVAELEAMADLPW